LLYCSDNLLEDPRGHVQLSVDELVESYGELIPRSFNEAGNNKLVLLNLAFAFSELFVHGSCCVVRRTQETVIPIKIIGNSF